MGEKVFKTIEQQVELLTSRGLIIPDEDMQMAKEFLLHNNYYRISGYTLTLKKLLLQIENDGKTEIDNAHLFGFILVMRRILSVTQFEKLKKSLESLSDKYLFVDMKHYGFPENWKEIL